VITAIEIIGVILLAAMGNVLAQLRPAFGAWWYGGWAIACVVTAAISAARHEWALAAWMAVCAVLNAIWWDQSRKRRKRKRAAALAGAKSRARIAKLVRRTRESMQPRPVPQPVPRGGQ
jgi:membrane protein implicated in regulation of membrane protease activity